MIFAKAEREDRKRPRFRSFSYLHHDSALFLVVLLTMAWTAVVSRAETVPGLRFEPLSIEQGLSQSSVNCLLQDHVGFLWLGTQSGLNRFDGYAIETYRQGSGILNHNWISALAEDDSGALWIGTEGGGLTRWDHQRRAVDHYQHDSEDPTTLSSDRVRTLTFDDSGSLWIGTVESGLNRLDPNTGKMTRFRYTGSKSDLADDRIRTVIQDKAGRIWVGSLGGLDLYDPEREVFLPIPLESPGASESDTPLEVQALLEDSRGRLWVGTQTGLARFDSLETDPVWFYRSDPNGIFGQDWIRALFQDKEGRIWAGTHGGVSLWKEDRKRWLTLQSTPGDSSSDQILAITQDRGGNLWFGTFKDGAQKWNPRALSFEHYTGFSQAAGAGDHVFAVSVDSAGYLWIGSFGGGLSKIDRTSGDRITYLHDPNQIGSLSSNRVTALLHDRLDNLWIGTASEGLNFLHVDETRTNRLIRYRHDPREEDSLSAVGVTTLHQDPAGRIWVGTYGSGLNHFTGSAFRRYRHDPADPTSLSNDRVLAVVDDRDGKGLWIATDGGLNHFDPETESFTSWHHRPDVPASLGSNELFSLALDPAGRLWIGTKGDGLDLLEAIDPSTGEATFRNYSLRHGLPDPTVWGIEADMEGHIWISTNKGLAQLDPETDAVRVYDTSHGLQSLEFNLGAHFQSPEGELFFGGVNGVNAFFPEGVRVNTTPPNVVLTDLSLLNQPLEIPGPLWALETLELEHDDHFLSFEFAALDFTAPEKNRYRYRLEGLEESWVDLGTDRTVSFASLQPGKYELRVQGSNSDGVWSPSGTAVGITVAPPLWRTWWFRSLLLFFAAASVVVAHRLRVRSIRTNSERLAAQVEARTQELEAAQERLVRKEKLAVLGELSGSVAHELRNPLGIIKNSVFFLRLTQKMVDDKAKEHLALIEREIKRSDRIIGELLDYAKEPVARTEPVTVARLVEVALETAEIPSGVRLSIDLEEPEGRPLEVEVDPGQIDRVLGNLLQNAVQAMPDGGKLDLEAVRHGDEAWIRVRDTGVGIEEEDLDRIFEPLFTRKIYGIGLGLPLSMRYTQMNGGRLEYESRVGEGTTFHLYLPLAT